MPVILRISEIATSVMGDSEVKPGPGDSCFYVKIRDIPEGVSSGQVIVLFEHTAKKAMERGKYQFQFSELCPIGGVDLNWRVGPPSEKS